MKVRDILKAKGNAFEQIAPEASLKEAMDKIVMKRIGSLLVMEDNRLQGIITERDLFWRLHRDGDRALNLKVREAMTDNVVIGLPDDDIESVEALMTRNRFRHLPIMDGIEVIGIISIGDIIKILASNLEIENRYLKDYIVGRYPA